MAYSGTVGQTRYSLYMVINKASGKKYIGVTSNLAARWKAHRSMRGCAPALHAAMKKYGSDQFVFVHLADAFNEEVALQLEIALIEEHATVAPRGYNITSGGNGVLRPSDEHREKLSRAHAGKVQSEETKMKRSASLRKAYAEGRHTGPKGKTWNRSPEARAKDSANKSGEKNPNYGKTRAQMLADSALKKAMEQS